jgi:chemotaxis regulatin CheY-phosphate phosphatase CheZ
MTNRLLIQQADFGESREALEKNWQKWLHHQPFDAPVARRLADIYRQHLARLDPKTDTNTVQWLERKLRRTDARARRYGDFQSDNQY